MSYIEELKQKVSKEKLEYLYCNQLLGRMKCAEALEITLNAVIKLIQEYNLTQDKHAARSKLNFEVKNREYNKLKEIITRDTLFNYYITEDHGYEETFKHLNISEWTFDRLLREYNIKKDRSLSFEKGFEKRIQKYGRDNINNWKGGHDTRILNSGSLEDSYKEGYQKQLNTMLERYGVKCSFLKDELNAKKKHSGPNEKFERLLNINKVEHEREFVLDLKAFDFRIGNKLIEINPLITHNVNFNPFNKANEYKGIEKDYHFKKSLLAKENDFTCIHVWPWEDFNKIINLLLPRERVFARKCEVKEVALKESKDFINKYHLQGYARAKIKAGLYYNNELISIMTFGKPRYNKKYDYELIRYCSSKSVIGGSSKIFKYFLDKFNVNSVISYCDNSKFSGEVYKDLGFNKTNKGVPTRHWCNLKLEHYTDGFIRQQGFSRVIHRLDAKEDNLETNDNYILMRKENFLEVFDCGQSVFVWQKI